MLERLHLKNVGPAPELEMEFAPRVNLITGDNGLGKSFLLDVAFFALTGDWANIVIPRSTKTMNSQDISRIEYRFTAKPHLEGMNTWVGRSYLFGFRSQSWGEEYGPSDVRNTDTLVVQNQVDGAYNVFDPARGSFIFQAKDVWDSLTSSGPAWDRAESHKTLLSNGLISDWATWQLENGEAFEQFKAALVKLSPDENEKLEPGKLTRVSLDDARNIPTLIMPYGQEVPITQASAGIRRVVSLAYMLVWTWQEHLRAAELTRQEPAREIVLLIDELEQHLHPRWQRVILPALLETVKELMKSDVRVQIIATTHSPMVMASLEPLYEDGQDAWFDLDLVKDKVTLERKPWRKHGGADDWLTSDAFDLETSGSLPREIVIEEAGQLLRGSEVSREKFLEVDQKLRRELGEADEFWVRWRYIGEKRGWL